MKDYVRLITIPHDKNMFLKQIIKLPVPILPTLCRKTY